MEIGEGREGLSVRDIALMLNAVEDGIEQGREELKGIGRELEAIRVLKEQLRRREAAARKNFLGLRLNK